MRWGTAECEWGRAWRELRAPWERQVSAREACEP